MALTLTYDDAYLAPLIAAKETWETRALADVADLGTFPDPWPDKLAVLRAYILCCLAVSYIHLRAHETPDHLVCRRLLENKKYKN